MRPALLLLAGLATMACAMAQPLPINPTWKWRDASGQIVVSDRPPPASVPAKDILESPQSAAEARRPSAPPVASRTAAAPAAGPGAQGAAAAPARPDGAPRTDPELEARRKRAAEEQASQQDAQKKAEEQKNAAVRAENCSRARGHLAALQDGQRMTRTNERGEREVIDDAQRAAEMQRARSVIASDCK